MLLAGTAGEVVNGTDEERFHKWSGIGPIFPRYPFKKDCRWTPWKVTKGLSKLVQPFDLCVMNEPDFVSDTIVTTGQWGDCLPLIDMWTKVKDNHPQLGSPLYVDIGANIGSCSMMMLNAGAEVISIEPVPQSAYYYTRSILALPDVSKKDKVKVYNVGCGRDYSTHQIFVAATNAGQAMLDKPGNPIAQEASTNVSIVPCDDLLWPGRLRGEKPPHIAVLKIDVEGYEPVAFEGLKELFKAKAIRSIKTELSHRWLSYQNTTASGYCNLLMDLGFELFFKNGTFCTLDDCYKYNTLDKEVDIIGYLKS